MRFAYDKDEDCTEKLDGEPIVKLQFVVGGDEMGVGVRRMIIWSLENHVVKYGVGCN